MGHLIHHEGAADGDDAVEALTGCQQVLDHGGIAILLAEGAIVGGDQDLIADGLHALEPVEEETAASLDEGDDPIAFLLERPGDGVDAANAVTAAGAQHAAPAIEVQRLAQRADEGGQGIAGVQVAQFVGGGADLQEGAGDGSRFPVPVGDGERDALSVLVGSEDDELARLDLGGDGWCSDGEQV